ncbi:class I SAM-dependent methyltransferase [Mycobacterium heckeshornense]|uniref:SAM-dependent methyltransferase n=1 Tax=Mycobacterium heckeshornense TaxID=110505 RepID=UPI0006621349|nr:class I SAM-dependent methyltransferase [Mycobacterium heckeshornense]KMV24382.1 SAM-dependent methyltransferase [Mycobacterium heckeshornense]MCV7035437.1 class I SAM-dependent methyltransferase [Mycobacterium heckeshornense]PIJ37989.1 class I SAM-dependent methyltransferase [Mycobacterium heckeshornense]
MVRTDNDSWDPATSVGATATMVATARAVATKRGLISDPFAEPLVRAVGVDFFIRLAAGELDMVDLGDDFVFGTMTDLFAVRTRFFDGFCADAAIAGIRQLVILASGLDARPYRLWWPPGTTVYELDQPDVIEFKTRTLRSLGAAPTAKRRAVGVDLRRGWPAALRRVGFDANQPSAWIAEGLLIGFLPPDAQNRLLDNVTALSAAGSRFAADHGPSHLQARHEPALAARWREHGLDIDMSELTFPGEHDHVAAYLAAHGWETVDTPLADVCVATGLPGLRRGARADAPVSSLYVTAVFGGQARNAVGR